MQRYPTPVDYAATLLVTAWESGVGQIEAMAEVTAMVERMEADLAAIKAMQAIPQTQGVPVVPAVKLIREGHSRGDLPN